MLWGLLHKLFEKKINLTQEHHSGVCLDIMKQTATYTERARASLARAEGATTPERKFHQLHIAEAQLQYADRYEADTINKRIDLNQLWAIFKRLV